MSSIHFYIPRVAARAVNFPAIRAAARKAGVTRASVAYSDYQSVRGRTRITCAPEIALLLVAELRVIAAAATELRNTELLIACANGISAAFKAIDEERARSVDVSPMSDIESAG